MIEIDRGHDIPAYSDPCTLCAHLHDSHDRPGNCHAFPDGIPREIWMGDNNHREPYEGDGGVLYESVAGTG